MGTPFKMTRERIAQLSKDYPVGSEIELIHTADEFTSLKPGDRGKVTLVDGAGTLFVAWENGSNLGLISGVDSWRKAIDSPTDLPSYYQLMNRALEIFCLYEGDQYFSAEHDTIYAGPDPSLVSAEHITELKELGWHTDENGCFYHFT